MTMRTTMMRDVALLLVLLWLGCCVAAAAAAGGGDDDAGTAPTPSEPRRKPSFVIFLADDMGYGDVTYYGAPTTHTPNIDRIIREGKDFRQFYAAASVCSPSRAGLMTGRDPVRMGIFSRILRPSLRVFFPWNTSSMPSNETTIAGLLKTANYTSHYVGKWHLGHVNALPVHRGFDGFFGIPYSHDMCSEVYGVEDLPIVNRAVPPLPLMRNADILEQPADFSSATDRFTDEAVKFVHEHADQPFFLVVSYYQPHIPHVTPLRYKFHSLRGPFGDSVQEMDVSIGQVMQAIKDAGIDDNTLVMVTSDNGPWVDSGIDGGSPGPMRGAKGTTWEGGTRVVSAFRWPGVIEPLTTEMTPVSMMDLFSTFGHIAGLNVTSTPDFATDSHSFAHLLNSSYAPSAKSRPAIYYFYHDVLMAIRMGPFKLHKYTRCAYCYEEPVPQDPPLLFNIDHDPGEQHPLSVEDHLLIVDALEAEYDRYLSTISPRQPLFDQFKLDAAPCCSPQPYLQPCNCTHANMTVGEAAQSVSPNRQSTSPASAKIRKAAKALYTMLEKKHPDLLTDKLTSEEVSAAFESLIGSPMEPVMQCMLGGEPSLEGYEEDEALFA
ncbi:hypothetical protein PTSG_01338 [Salpingoeca rosetta]|uniref:Sulfatase N-terminal domain-containing protein n=1 Tax=Salpingoeca rosetta (strain ATCC 50818 / BSB-021) TaxID=946362 RepID=F2U022_SALR5|nr:uncharacterized protein PTSG_01338 [Salpingoeca rosetta]EGD80750.1 hypothetical protein PTSG_01338 [Salpingoeca rosetta]|eukprot:XP_004997311.1 hypothetical protein PTSG_01338 [Salpingoeca rosetta]